jgi:transposase
VRLPRRPGHDAGAGQRRRGPVRRGTRWLKAALVQAAWAARRRQGGYLPALERSRSRRRGRKRAPSAVAQALLVTWAHRLSKGEDYRDP